jgi:hypothetical protein
MEKRQEEVEVDSEDDQSNESSIWSDEDLDKLVDKWKDFVEHIPTFKFDFQIDLNENRETT